MLTRITSAVSAAFRHICIVVSVFLLLPAKLSLADGLQGFLLSFSPVQWAHAQTLSAPSSAGMDAALGSATSGSETGIYEIRETIETGWGVIIAIALVVVGFMLVRRLFRRAGAG